MKQGNVQIDESIKIDSFANTPYHEDVAHQLFQKYAQNQKAQPVPYDPNIEQLRPIGTDDSQIRGYESGFRKLKFEQIEKLKDLRSEYEEIKKITTDYATPKASKASSLHSSSRMDSEHETQQHQMSKGSKVKESGGGRQVQILQLQKKRLEAMVENSMRKIEELLHNEMEFKKVIHELKLQNQNKSESDSDVSYRLLRKKEKEYSEEMRILELERETLLSSTSSHKEKIKYLESNLANCEQELRKMLDEKRNYDQLIRMEKDRYMNLQIEFRRQKREHEIMEKDKNAEINRLLKLKDIHEDSADKQMRNSLAALQDEVKLKDKRYGLLLEQFQTFQKERIKEEKEQEARIVTELLAKNPVDSQSKIMQQTISGIMNRLKDLEKKPIIEIDDVISPKIKEPFHVQQQLEQKISEFNTNLQQKTEENQHLHTENQYLHEKVERLQREVTIFKENQADFHQIIDKLKKSLKKNRKDKSQGEVTEVRLNSEPSLESNNSVYSKDYESQLQLQRKEKAILATELESLSSENRELRQRVSKLEFEVDKKSKQAQFQSELQIKAHQAELLLLNKQISTLQQSINHQYQKGQRQRQLQLALEQRSAEVQQLKRVINLERGRSKNQSNVPAIVNELNIRVKVLTEQNQKLQELQQYSIALQHENDDLRRWLVKTRSINAETDNLWSQKQAEYQNIDEILRSAL